MISESEVELKRDAALEQLLVQLERVDQVAVVGERDLAARAVGALRALHRLGVLPGVGAGGRVAHVADRELAGERAQVVLAEDLVDEAELAARDDVPAAVGRGDARPTPGRGAAARRGRSTTDAPPRGRARTGRTRRTRRAVHHASSSQASNAAAASPARERAHGKQPVRPPACASARAGRARASRTIVPVDRHRAARSPPTGRSARTCGALASARSARLRPADEDARRGPRRTALLGQPSGQSGPRSRPRRPAPPSSPRRAHLGAEAARRSQHSASATARPPSAMSWALESAPARTASRTAASAATAASRSTGGSPSGSAWPRSLASSEAG